MGSQVIDVLLAAVCLGIGVLHLGTSAGRRGEALAHGVMGLGMAAMFVPSLDPMPRWAWIAVFLALGVWAGAAALRASGRDARQVHVHHLVGAAAMLFMALTPTHHHGGSGGPDGSLLLAVVALGFTAWFLADVARMLTNTAPPGPDGAAGPVATQARLQRPARIAMSAAMAVMLVAG
ncbi:MAG: DUF5134 domain-containing protein [Pseudonocardia sp.]